MPFAHDDKVTAPLALLIEDCKKELAAISSYLDSPIPTKDGGVDFARTRRREVHETLLRAHDSLAGHDLVGSIVDAADGDDYMDDDGDDDEDEDEDEDD